jgi:cyclophilin family peptidyl-prolyl cis-trans isomerase
MRPLPSLLVLTLAFSGQLAAQNADLPTTFGTIPSQSIVQPVRTPAIDLRNYFRVTGITGQVVQFSTGGVGNFNVEMNSTLAPATVANFLAYVNANRFTNTLVHRSNPSLAIIQGGGYSPNTGTFFTDYFPVQKNAPLIMETGNTLPHARGTLAMARTSELNSATSEWFINTANNTAVFDPASVQGVQSYAVFGRVTGTGMSVVDTIATLPVLGGNITVTNCSTGSPLITVDGSNLPANFGPGWAMLGTFVETVIGGNFVNLAAPPNRNIPDINVPSPQTIHYGMFGSPFGELPVFNQRTSYGNGSLSLTELIKMTSITAVPVFPTTLGAPSVITFSAVSSNPGLVAATVRGSNLYVAAARNLTGSATVTVTATDTNGNAVSQTPFNVTVTRNVVDFNSDARADIVFQSTAGQIFTWRLNNTGAITSTAYITTAALGDWKVASIADMNGDGIADLLLQNGIGQVGVWYLNASGVLSSSAVISGSALGDWKIMATADINGDGKTDLLFQNNIGQIAVWYMNGSGGVVTSAYLSAAGLGDWRLRCGVDINSDGVADLIFQNTSGQVAGWLMDPTGGIILSGLVYTGALGDWKVASAADINGDGIPDLLFQNNIGQIAVWYMNGGSALSTTGYLSTSGLGDWRLH